MTIKVTFAIYDDPTAQDPNPIWTIEAYFNDAETSGNSIGWAATQVVITSVGNDPNVSWTDASPNVQTTDELWWIDHADPEDPVASEFVVSPKIDGTGSVAGQTDLNYEFQGEAYDGDAYFPVTASLTFEFKKVGQPEPEISRTDEPVRVDVQNLS